MSNSIIDQMREAVTSLGVQELHTPEEVDTVIPNSKGTMLVFVNSVCRCAAGMARPGLAEALEHQVRPDHLVSVFAGQDREATARARQYFGDEPPSSPSFALLKDGKLMTMIHRNRIEHRSAPEVARDLIEAFDRYCGPTEN